jgi:hypothetical protein
MKRIPMIFWISLLCAVAAPGVRAESRWWKGNLHTHSLWSDGDDFPEMIAAWYKEQGYEFLALTDHNVLPTGQKWVSGAVPRVAAALPGYVEKFGSEWVEVRGGEDKREVRLKTFPEFRTKLEEAGRFLMLQSEEITARFSTAPLHVNALNLREVVEPPTGSSIVEVLQKCFGAVAAQRKKTGTAMVANVNHPNFGWAVTAEELMLVDGMSFFEVYNGHPSVRNSGDSRHAGTEKMWDIVLAERLSRLGKPLVYGLASDDAHNYLPGKGNSRAGRGWIVVRAPGLQEEALVAAMEKGDFYASNGVRLRNVEGSESGLKVEVDAEPGVRYRIDFIGTRKGYSSDSEPVVGEDGSTLRVTRRYSPEVGAVLSSVEGERATYTFRGDEWYVRAVVRSDRFKKDPSEKGEMESAWGQPVRGPVR